MNLVVLSKIDLTGVMLITGGVFSRDRAEQIQDYVFFYSVGFTGLYRRVPREYSF